MHVTDSLQLALTTKPSVKINIHQILESFFIFSNLKSIFCMQECHSRMAQVEYQGKTRYTKVP